MSIDFIGQDADERRKREIETVVKTVREITIRLLDEQVFGQSELLTELLPAIILDQTDSYGYGEFYGDLDKVLIATQKLLMETSRGDDDDPFDEPDRVGLGCRWSDPKYEGTGSEK